MTGFIFSNGLPTIPAVMIYDSMCVMMIGASSVHDLTLPIMNCICAIPCSVESCCMPMPPQLSGAYTTAIGICRLKPIFGSSVCISGCCILSSMYHGIVDAPSPYFSVGSTTVVYPWRASYWSSGACANTCVMCLHFSWSNAT